MKTLASRNDANQIERRFELVSKLDQPRWGKMTPGEMVCHLRDAYAIGLGTFRVAEVKTPVPRIMMKWVALRAPMRWPKNFKTVPELEFSNGAPAPVAFLTDKAALIDTYWQFVATNGDWPPHPFFGRMKRKDWMRWGYLHADHHLRQFGR
jgi:hypothetical protein